MAAERTAGAKAHRAGSINVVEKPRQAHIPAAQRASVLHKDLKNIRGEDEREDAKCPTKRRAHRERVRKPANLINPVLSFPWPDILCNWQPASGGSFGQFVCVLIAM